MRLLYTIVAFELFLGGGGRLLEVGPLTVRMLLFAVVLLVIVGMPLVKPRRDDQYLKGCAWVLAFLAVHIIGFNRGLLNGHEPATVLADMQQSFFWVAAPFFAVAMSDLRLVRRTEHLVINAAVVMSIVYLATILAVLLGFVDPFTLWEVLSPTEEFFFRNELLFFYKGNLYLGIAIVFLVSARVRRPWVLLLIVVALLLTLTRGFVLAAFVTLFIMFVFQGRWSPILRMLSVTLLALLVIQGILDFRGETLLGDRDASDGLRIADFRYMFEQMTVGTMFIGEGFGSLINGRMNTETSYAWMLWKGGLPLLAFWLLPICVCFLAFLGVPRKSPHYRLACAYFFSVVFIYVQTATNPFLNNPIGLSFVMIAMFSLPTLAAASRRKASAPPPPILPSLAVDKAA